MEIFNESRQTDLINGNALIMGLPNSGTTLRIKNEALKHLEKGNKVMLYDFQGIYKDIKKVVDTNELVINSLDGICLFEFNTKSILDLEKDEDLYRREYISFCIQKTKSLLNLFNRSLERQEEKLILNTVVNLLKMNGITESTYATREENSNLFDFLMLLKQENEELYNEVSHFKESFTCRKTTLAFESRLNHLVFDINHLMKNERELLLHTYLLMTTAYTQDLPPCSTVLISDLSMLMSSVPLKESLEITMKTAKKFNTTYILAHHSLSKLIQGNGESILANSSKFVFYKQAREEVKMLEFYFDLKEEEVCQLTALPKDNFIHLGL